jgi:hypothetical protein
MELRDNEVDAVPLVPPSRALATAEARARTAEARAGAAEAAAAAAVAEAAAAVVAAAQKEAARQHLLHLHAVHAAELAALRVEVQRLRQEMAEMGSGAGPGGEFGLPSRDSVVLPWTSLCMLCGAVAVGVVAVGFLPAYVALPVHSA